MSDVTILVINNKHDELTESAPQARLLLLIRFCSQFSIPTGLHRTTCDRQKCYKEPGLV